MEHSLSVRLADKQDKSDETAKKDSLSQDALLGNLLIGKMANIGRGERRNDIDDGILKQLVRYQFTNHLGSAVLELDEKADIISYEEYSPYGSTSYQAVPGQTETPKRYRYTGKERDEESGLNFHGATYFACWLGRWVSVDPSALTYDTKREFELTLGQQIDRVNR